MPAASSVRRGAIDGSAAPAIAWQATDRRTVTGSARLDRFVGITDEMPDDARQAGPAPSHIRIAQAGDEMRTPQAGR